MSAVALAKADVFHSPCTVREKEGKIKISFSRSSRHVPYLYSTIVASFFLYYMDTSQKKSRGKLVFKILAAAIVAFFLFAVVCYLLEEVPDPEYTAVDRSAVEEDPGNVYPVGNALVTSYLDTLPSYTGNDPEGLMLATYSIGNNGSLTKKELGSDATYTKEMQNLDEHTFIWNFYADIFQGVSEFSYLKTFIINTDGIENSLASVRLDENNVWELYIDPVDALKDGKIFDEQDFVYSLVHEFGHLLTLNESQADPGIYYEDDCSTVLLQEGCVFEKSYYNQYFMTFWEGDMFDAWYNDVDGAGEDAAYYFAIDHPDDFLTNYSSTAPEEDIAEVFANFVLRDKPAATPTTVAEEKLVFFYQFSDLVDIRQTIRDNIEQLDPKFFTRPLIIK